MRKIVGMLPIIIGLTVGIFIDAYARSLFTVTDLGTLGGTISVATDINNEGVVVGITETVAGDTVGFIWDSTNLMREAGTSARAVNDINVVVGGSGSKTAYRWTETGGFDPIGITHDLGIAFDINNQGQIVGEHTTATTQQASLLDGVRRDLGFLAGNRFSSAQGLNDLGIVVGISDAGNSEFHAFIWDDVDGMRDLGTLDNSPQSIARKINKSGTIIGQSLNAAQQSRAVIWTPSLAILDLGTTPGTTQSAGRAINDAGLAVGVAFNNGNDRRAFLWDGITMSDLNTLVPMDSGWMLEIANGINNRGQIVGHGLVGGEIHGFLLTSVPEPVADAGLDQTVDEGNSVTLDGSQSTGDGDPLTSYVWSQPGGPTVVLDLTDPQHPTFTAPLVGGSTTLTFQLIVGDGTDISDPDTVDIMVVDVNNPPIADAGENQTVDETPPEGTNVTLDGSGSSDPDGDDLTYEWIGPFGTASGIAPTVSFPLVGVHHITLTVTDEADADMDLVTITVNALPVANAGEDFTVDFKKKKSTPVQFDGSGSDDPDGQVASYEWHIDGELVGEVAMPIVELEVGVYTATLTVTDDDEAQDTDEVIVTVTKNGSDDGKPGGNDKPCNPNSPKCAGN